MKTKSSLLILIFTAGLFNFAKASPLEDKAIILQDTKTKLQFIQEGTKQFLVSLNLKTGKEIRKLMIWPGKGDGNLSQLVEVKKSKKVQVIVLNGLDGDYSFSEIIAWNPESGALVHLLSEDSFSMAIDLRNEVELELQLAQKEDAPDVGSVQLISKTDNKNCAELISQISKIDAERTAIVKRAGAIPKGKDSEKMSQLSNKKAKIAPKKFSFNLKDFAKVKVSCQ